MKQNIGNLSRILLAVAAIALVIVLFVPIWRIDLVAPQYPEGLYLLIYGNKLAGNVDIINGLNHYIGMKTLHTEDFIEFRVLSYLIAFFALLFLVAAIVGKKKVLLAVVFLFILFGIVAMVDFWKWEYEYGHHLDPEAAIKVPGMSYQPPLIGYKQLLNFSAYSMPDWGGWIFIGVGVIAVATLFLSGTITIGKKKPVSKTVMTLVAGICLLMVSCHAAPQPIKIGKDNCYFCKMTITDLRFGAEVISQKGKIFKFDDMHCLLSFMKGEEGKQAASIYFTSFDDQHTLIKSDKALFYQSDNLRSPMGGNVAVLSDAAGLKELAASHPGKQTSWKELLQP